MVCARCSPHLTAVDGYDRPQRTCKDCHSFQKNTRFCDRSLSLSLSLSLSHFSFVHYELLCFSLFLLPSSLLFPLHLSSTPTSLSTHSIEESGQSSEYQATLASVYPALSHNQRWKLLPNDNAYNNNIR